MTIDLILTRLFAYFGKKEDLYRLGIYYYEGAKVSRNLDKAIPCFQKSADKQYKKSLYYLGLIELEQAALKNAAIAWRFFELAKFNEPRANDEIKKLEAKLLEIEVNVNPEIADQLFKIGYMYAHDKIVFRDLKKAQKYFERAARLGNHHAQEALDEMSKQPINTVAN